MLRESTYGRDTYKIRLYPADASQPCSDTHLRLPAELSPKLSNTNIALLIGNTITSVVTNRPTALQITLGTILRDKSFMD